MPGQIHDVRGNLLFTEFALVRPILAGIYGHADEHLRVVWHALGRQMLAFERFGENVFHAQGDVSQKRIERAGRIGFRRIAGEHSESFSILLNIGEQCQRRAFHDLTGVRLWVGERVDERVGKGAHLTVHHHSVQALFASEMLVHNGFRHFRGGGDLLHAHCFKTLRREQRTTDFDELLTPLIRRHSGCIGHAVQFFMPRG